MDKILVVDGSIAITELMSECLSSSQYEVMTAESGFNAIAKIEAFSPDLIILDCDLPDVSGFDICKKIKSNNTSKYMMVLMTSYNEGKDIKVRATNVGADDFLEKPFDSYFLIARVKSLLRIKYLSDELKAKFVELEEKNSILEFQLKMGKTVQSSLMPKIDLKFKNLEFSSKYLPAFDVGGDFYNVFPIDEDSIALVIGDVSGFGIAAALLTAMLNQMVKNLASKYFNPDQLLFVLNNEFYETFENTVNEMYSVVFYAVFNTKEKKIYYSNAGGCLPFFVDSVNGKVIELKSKGVPVGIMKNSQYEFNQLSYNDGDLIFFHTDGLSDTFYRIDTDEFSKKLSEILLESYSSTISEEIIDIVLSSFYNYNKEINEEVGLDDISIVLCKM